MYCCDQNRLFKKKWPSHSWAKINTSVLHTTGRKRLCLIHQGPHAGKFRGRRAPAAPPPHPRLNSTTRFKPQQLCSLSQLGHNPARWFFYWIGRVSLTDQKVLVRPTSNIWGQVILHLNSISEWKMLPTSGGDSLLPFWRLKKFINTVGSSPYSWFPFLLFQFSVVTFGLEAADTPPEIWWEGQ